MIYRFQGFALDVGGRKLRNPEGQEIKLSSRAFDALAELVQHRGETLSKDHLMSAVWTDLVVEENNLNQAISLVRKVLGDSTGESLFIKTVPGKGFCFVAEVQVENVAEQATPADENPFTAASDKRVVDGAPSRARPLWVAAVAIAASLLVTIVYVFSLSKPDSANPSASAVITANTNSQAEIIPDSIAVMPFSNLAQDAASDLFVVSLHDELINQLAKVKSLKVISRDSVLSVAANGGSVLDMADFLHVESLMTGSILVMHGSARINLQVQSADTGVVLWGESFEVDTQDLSAMVAAQHDIALKVSKALQIDVKPPESVNLAVMPTTSFEAYRYYLTARNSFNHQDDAEKWVLISKALALDPDYPDALLYFASLNSLFMTNPLDGFTYEQHQQLMLDSVDALIRLQPQRGDGYALKAVALGTKRDWEGVAQQLAMLKRLDVSEAEKKYVALLLMSLGDFEGAISIYEESLITEPANLYSRGLLMAAYEMSGNPEQARQEYALGNELKSVWWGNTVQVLLALGRKEPIGSTAKLKDISPALIHVLDSYEDPEVVSRGVKSYLASTTQNSRDDVFYSALAASHGDLESAHVLMRGAMEKVSTSIFWAWLPVFDELRMTPEFRQILSDFGLVAYWQQHQWPAICQPRGASFSCDSVAHPAE